MVTWPCFVFTNFGTCPYQCSLSNFTSISLRVLKCSWAHCLLYLFMYCSFASNGLAESVVYSFINYHHHHHHHLSGLFSPVLLLNQLWSSPLRLHVLHCKTVRVMCCDVPRIAVFCGETIECFPGVASCCCYYYYYYYYCYYYLSFPCVPLRFFRRVRRISWNVTVSLITWLSLSRSLHWTTRLPLIGFLCNFVLVIYTKVYQLNSSLV